MNSDRGPMPGSPEDSTSIRLKLLCPAWCCEQGQHRTHRSEALSTAACGNLDNQLDAWIEQQPGRPDPVLRFRAGSTTITISLPSAKFFASLIDTLVGDLWAVVSPSSAAS